MIVVKFILVVAVVVVVIVFVIKIVDCRFSSMLFLTQIQICQVTTNPVCNCSELVIVAELSGLVSNRAGLVCPSEHHL